MTAANWPTALAFVWQPQNDGSRDDSATGEAFATSYGVTQGTWDEAVQIGLVTGSIDTATKDQCETILHGLFWDVMDCDAMPSGCDLTAFNDAMVCGVHHAARLIERILGTEQDGSIGPNDQTAIAVMGAAAFIPAMHDADEQYYAALANAPLFLKGWDRREDACEAAALALVP